jgi:hypothetical protein
MWILMGIVQFGFIFAAYLTLNNAVREAARQGSIYVYSTATGDAAANDLARDNLVVDQLIQSRGILFMSSRGSSTNTFNTSSNGTSTSSSVCSLSSPTAGRWFGTSATNWDVSICYSMPTGVVQNEPRRGYYLDVQTWYHQQMFIPLLDQFLPNDPAKGSGWIRLPAHITVVIN